MSEFEVAANFHFGVKIPADVRGGPRYGSEEFGGSLTLKETIEAGSEAEARQLGSLRLAQIAQQVKLFVANEAGVDTVTGAKGVIQVKLPGGAEATQSQDVVAAAPAPQQFDPTPQQQPTQGRIEWDGRPVRIFDNRPKKESGEANPNSPDLNAQYQDVDASAPPQVRYEGAWLNNKDGTPSKKGQRMLALYEEQQRRWRASQANDEAPF